MDLQLKDKLALVTGSTAGIGYAIAEALVREGARTIVNGRTQAAVSEAVGKLGKGAIGFAGDLSDAARAADLVRQYPDVEILVNNLGIFEPKPFEEIPDEDWARPTSLIKRFIAPEEVGAMVAYVASPLAAATNGAALRVDGGVVKSAF